MFWKRRKQSDFNAEVKSHLEIEADDLAAEGLNPESARRVFGNVTAAEERFYESRRWLWFEQFAQDLRYGLRMLRRNPAFTSIAVLSLALGIGANTAVFSLVDAVMLKSLPVRAPQELRVLNWVWEGNAPLENHSGYRTLDPKTGQRVSGSFSYPAYRLFVENVPQFSDLVGYARYEFTLTANGSSEFAAGQIVTGNYFTALGAQPLIGRPILAEDDVPGRPRVAVLTYRCWDKRFALDPGVIGRDVLINQRPVTVVGVMPPAFQGLYPGAATDVFVPMAMDAEVGPERFSLSQPDTWWVQIFGRLRPGASEKAAEEGLRGALGHAIEAYRKNAKTPPVILRPGGRGVGLLRNSVSSTLSILGAVVSLVLLIACVNLANLLVARSTARRREMAVRLSIGAGTGRLIRQLLTESLLLAGIGGAAGLGDRVAAVENLGSSWCSKSEALGLDARVDLRTLAFTAGATLLAGLLFGTLPAWRATRLTLAPALKEGATAATGGRPRMRLSRLLVSAQVALSILLLVGAGLFVRTLLHLSAVDLGFRPERVLAFDTDPSRSGYKDRRLTDVYARLQANLARVPGVESVGMSEQGLMQNSERDSGIYVPGGHAKGEQSCYLMYCSASFLSTMRIPVLLGRDLEARDERDAGQVAVVNQRFVDAFLSGKNPLGQIFYMGGAKGPTKGEKPIQVVGVAKNAHYTGVRDEVPPIAYIPYTNLSDLRGMTFAIRTALPPLGIATAVRRVVAETDRTIPVAALKTEEQQIAESIATERLFAGSGERIRRHCGIAGCHRALRRDGLRGGAEDGGNRNPPGIGSAPRRDPVDGSAPEPMDGCAGTRDRNSGRAGVDAPGAEHAIRRGAH